MILITLCLSGFKEEATKLRTNHNNYNRTKIIVFSTEHSHQQAYLEGVHFQKIHREGKEARRHTTQLLLCLTGPSVRPTAEHSDASPLSSSSNKKSFPKKDEKELLFFLLNSFIFLFCSVFKNNATFSHVEEDGGLGAAEEPEEPKPTGCFRTAPGDQVWRDRSRSLGPNP